jgi:hypothetical protein
MARFEALGLDGDRKLIRTPAKRLAEDEPETKKILDSVKQSVAAKKPLRTGGLLRALRNSPMVGADLDLSRPFESEREIDL